jgi:hypothetical protein
MSKNRIIYQTEALFAGKSPATGPQWDSTAKATNINELFRVQSANYGYTVNRRDVNQFGELAAIDRIILESPTVNLDFTYLNASFINEYYLGFYINSGQGDRSCITNILAKTEDERNYWIRTVPEGQDVVANIASGASNQVIGIGNGFISNFTTEGAVGDFPKTTVTVEGLNILFSAGATWPPTGLLDPLFVNKGTGVAVVENPAVNPTDGSKIGGWAAIPSGFTNAYGVATGLYAVSALRPGDITLSFNDKSFSFDTPLQEGGVSFTDAKIQSYSLSFSLSRDPLQKLGSKFAFAREITFPVVVTLRVDANVGDITSGNLADMISNDQTYNCKVKIKAPYALANGYIPDAMIYTLKNAKLESQSYTSSIGPNKAVSLTWTSQIGGPNQTDKGLFFSGFSGTTNR